MVRSKVTLGFLAALIPIVTGSEAGAAANERAINQLLAGTGALYRADATGGSGGSIFLSSTSAIGTGASYVIEASSTDDWMVLSIMFAEGTGGTDGAPLPGVTVTLSSTSEGDGYVINDAKIDWIGAGQNYNDVIIAATPESTGATDGALNRLLAPLGIGFYRTVYEDIATFEQAMTFRMQMSDSPQLPANTFIVGIDDVQDVSLRTVNGGDIPLLARGEYRADGSLVFRFEFPSAEGSVLPGATVTLRSDGTTDTVISEPVVRWVAAD